ncbi:hypothetical protein ACDQ55_11545 [Chitinophaga sp. 30R24]|uniref:hypothetical protein n=1 Tax=Chitinophaga sp. 30R24 TaxID=3248838 RepID=UPI003B91AAF2
MKKSILTLFLLGSGLYSFSQNKVIWGVDDSRTEQREDAGLQGATSGFFEANNPVNFPPWATSWWHLLDTRHSSPANNYAMQFAGSFFDQQLYFRKTNNDPAQPWSRVILETSGRVGIHNDYPRAFLDVGVTDLDTLSSVFARLPEGDSEGEGTYLGVRTHSTQPVNANSFSIEHRFFGALNSAITFSRGTSRSDGFMTFSTANGLERMRIDVEGNIGIGTASPQSKLAVAGTITAQRVKVTATGWPDYVFHEHYALPSLEELEQYVREHKHLPGIPAAVEVEKNGMDVGDMNKQLLQKVEELTLYIIELKKDVEALKSASQK